MARREDFYLNLMIGGDFLREAGVLEFAEVVKFSEEFRGRGLLPILQVPTSATPAP